MSDNIATALGLLIQAVRLQLGDDMAFSIILSRITREARRVYGLEGAQNMLRQHVKPTSAVKQDEVEVLVPDATVRVGPRTTAASEAIRSVIDGLRRRFSDQTAFAIMLSNTIAEAEEVYGEASLQMMIAGLIDTMPQAAQYDRS